MTRIDGDPIFRRTLLRNLTIAGTSAAGLVVFSSEPTVGYTQAIQVENPEGIRVAWVERYNGTVLEDDATDDRSEYGPTIDLQNVMPGDHGSLAIRVEPQAEAESESTYSLSLSMALGPQAENGITEPERKGEGGSTPDTTTDVGELADAIQVVVGYDSGVLGTGLLACDGSLSIGEYATLASGSLAEVAAALGRGVQIDPPGEDPCFAVDEGACIVFDWTLPEAVGNSVQTDAVEFDLAFHCEQCD